MTEGIRRLLSENGIKRKMQVIEEYKEDPDFRSLLYYALDPMITYRISEKMIHRPEHQEDAILFHDFFSCCEYLSGLRGIDDATVRQVNNLLYFSYEEDDREIMKKILSKTLRLGITASTVNKVIPGFIRVWDVQQAFSIQNNPVDGSKEFWLTQKLNGVRATYYDGHLIARSGALHHGLDHIINEISQFCGSDVVLDGELIIRNNNGRSDNENFRETTGLLNSDNEDKTAISFVVFDAIPRSDFDGYSLAATYKTRRRIMDSMADNLCDAEHVEFLPVLYRGKDVGMIDVLLDKMVKEDKEGLMLNYDVPYLRTRHKGILKIKRFYTMDLPIVGFEEGTGRLAGTLGSILVKFGNGVVGVGSGFTDEQRRFLWNSRESLEGTLCEVKYKEISYDKKTGQESLQFPVFVSIRFDKTEESHD